MKRRTGISSRLNWICPIENSAPNPPKRELSGYWFGKVPVFIDRCEVRKAS